MGPKRDADEVVGALGADAQARVSTLAIDTLAIDAAESVDENLASGAGHAERSGEHGEGPTTVPGDSRAMLTAQATIRAVAEGHADAAVSAGATGTVITAAVRSMGRLGTVPRPCLAATVPSLSGGPVVLLDVGACVDASAQGLLWHAVLGTGYASIVEAVDNPRVGLLSIGAEPGKGDRLRRAAAVGLTGLSLPAGGRYVGLVEGHDVPMGGPADVVVTDGFTGNVLLKGIEGAYALASGGDCAPTTASRAAALLGVDGTAVVCHGAATAAHIADGVALAVRLYRLKVCSRLSEMARELPISARGSQQASVRDASTMSGARKGAR